MKRKTIITGGDGFIGKALAARLAGADKEVVILDRKRGIEVGEWFMQHPDLRDVDVVYHLAAQTSVFNSNKTDIIHDNIDTFRIVCDACARSNVRMVYASSSTAADGNTTSLYGISKRFNEEYAMCYNPKARGVRFHNVYGPDPRQGTLLWFLLTQERVRLYNEGRNVRHFTYIEDIVRGLMMVAGTSTPLFNQRRLFNIANPEETSTLDFATTVCKYKPVGIELVAETRDFDRKEQVIDKGIYTVPLQYTTVADGIRRIFDGKEKK